MNSKGIEIMQSARIRFLIYPFLVMSIFGCGLIRSKPTVQPVEAVKTRQEIAAEKAVKAIVESVELEPVNEISVQSISENESWNRAVTAWYAGDIEQTAEEMKDYVELNPENATAHNVIGLDYYRQEFYDSALDEFQIAAELDPDEPQFSYNKAITLVRLERYDEAEQALENTTGLKQGEYLRQVYAELIPLNRASKLYNSGCDAMRKGDRIRAIDLFKSALKIKPDMVEAYVNLGALYRTWGDEKRQIRYFKEAIRIKPGSPQIHFNLGLAYFDAKMYSQAIAEFTRTIELDSYHRMAHFKLGMVFHITQNYADATIQFERCLEIFPHWHDAHLNLGTCYLKTGNVDGAIEQFGKAIKLRPSSAEAHYSLGEAYMRRKEFDKTATLFQRALEIDSGHKKARARLEELEKYQGKR